METFELLHQKLFGSPAPVTMNPQLRKYWRKRVSELCELEQPAVLTPGEMERHHIYSLLLMRSSITIGTVTSAVEMVSIRGTSIQGRMTPDRSTATTSVITSLLWPSTPTDTSLISTLTTTRCSTAPPSMPRRGLYAVSTVWLK
jgi:hypothetical protein